MKRTAAIVGLLAIALASCSAVGGSSGRITVTADFSDVNALEHHATVEMNGVTVGHVTSVSLDGRLARLTMSLDKRAHVPAGVVPVIRQQVLLGPDVVELQPPPGGGASGLLQDHAVLATKADPGRFEPDLESLVKSGTDLLGTLGVQGTSALAQVIAEGAQGFGGEGGDLRTFIDTLDTVVTGYASRTQTIDQLIGQLDQFSSTLAPDAQANAQALSNLAAATAVLDRQKDRLVNLLSSLSNVSTQGARLLDADLGAITDQLNSLRSVTQAVANQQNALGRVLYFLNGHNLATARSVHTSDDFVQVLNDFIVCGLPNGGEQPNSPLNSCSNVPQGATP